MVPVGGLDAGVSTDSNIKLSADELSAYHSSDLSGTPHIYYATRAARTAPFGAGSEVTSLSDALGERWASPSASGLYVVIERNSKLFEASRAATTDPWSAPTAPPELNEDSMAFPLTTGLPHLMPDGNTLYFSRVVVTSYDIFKSTRSGATWSAPVAVSELNVSGVNDWAPALTPDALTMYFGSSRASGDAGAGARSSIWVATRASVNDPFGAPRKVTELDQGTDIFPSWVSADNCRLYYSQKVDLGGIVPAYRSYVASQ
jgi:Tol biopolymer transport system component